MTIYYRVSVSCPSSELMWEDFTRETDTFYIRDSGAKVKKDPNRYLHFTDWQDAKKAQLSLARQALDDASQHEKTCLRNVQMLELRLSESPKEAAARSCL